MVSCEGSLTMMKKIFAVLLTLVLVLACFTAAFANSGIVKLGDSSRQVKTVQSLLKKYHYYTGKITGDFDQDTLKAVKEFQKYNHLNIDGKVGEKTMYYLNNSSLVVTAPIKDSTGDRTEVKHIQERLQHYGYYTGKIDGIYGSGTLAGVRAFQEANGLRVDGAVGASTLTKLDSNNAVSKSSIGTTYTKLKLNDSNATVKYVQKKLWALGYYNGDWSGVFGNETWKAVKVFQANNGLKVDGIVGPRTWDTLFGSPVSKPEYDSDVSAEIKGYQQQLIDLGWYTGSLTGKYDTATVAAVKGFQNACGLKVDGAVGPKTAAKLNAADAPTKAEYSKNQQINAQPKVNPGVQGSYVVQIQTILANKGYYTKKIDGKFGSGTLAAVKAFQTANGLKADGIVGTETWAALLK